MTAFGISRRGGFVAVITGTVLLTGAACGSASGQADRSGADSHSASSSSSSHGSATEKSAAPQATGAAADSRAGLQDLSWISTDDGWALAGARCQGGNTCAELARTTDGGRTWHRLPAPPMHPWRSGAGSAGAQIPGIRFDSATTGYLYGRNGALRTTDGGHTWRAAPGDPSVGALEPAGSSVLRLVAGDRDPATLHWSVQRKVADGGWRRVYGPRLRGGAIAGVQLVRPDARAAYLVFLKNLAGGVADQAGIYRSRDGGLSWSRLTGDPCSKSGGRSAETEAMAAARGGYVVALCDERGADRGFLLTSNNYGASWSAAKRLPGKTSSSAKVAAAKRGTIVVTTSRGLAISTDDGTHWRLASQPTGNQTGDTYLGFQTPSSGRVVVPPHTIWTTRDAGSHWTQTTYSATSP